MSSEAQTLEDALKSKGFNPKLDFRIVIPKEEHEDTHDQPPHVAAPLPHEEEDDDGMPHLDVEA